MCVRRWERSSVSAGAPWCSARLGFEMSRIRTTSARAAEGFLVTANVTETRTDIVQPRQSDFEQAAFSAVRMAATPRDYRISLPR
jgi:hypothetical protein